MKAVEVPEDAEGDHSYREAQCVTGCETSDVNSGTKYLFLQTEANERMRRNRPKVGYVFLDEELKENQPGAQAQMQVDARLSMYVSNAA